MKAFSDGLPIQPSDEEIIFMSAIKSVSEPLAGVLNEATKGDLAYVLIAFDKPPGHRIVTVTNAPEHVVEAALSLTLRAIQSSISEEMKTH